MASCGLVLQARLAGVTATAIDCGGIFKPWGGMAAPGVWVVPGDWFGKDKARIAAAFFLGAGKAKQKSCEEEDWQEPHG